MPDDFILTLDSDSEPETSAPSSSKRTTKSNKKQAPPKPEETEEFALDDGFELDFSALDGKAAKNKQLMDGVDFWGQEDDQVKGGKSVSTVEFGLFWKTGTHLRIPLIFPQINH
jgi:hypothetical protein